MSTSILRTSLRFDCGHAHAPTVQWRQTSAGCEVDGFLTLQSSQADNSHRVAHRLLDKVYELTGRSSVCGQSGTAHGFMRAVKGSLNRCRIPFEAWAAWQTLIRFPPLSHGSCPLSS